MSTVQSTQSYRLYPAYCFRASATYDAWVKLTAADVQALRSEPNFQSQPIYFHLNHPIRFVRLVGVVVAINEINVKYTTLTLDDGSGETIEAKIVRLTPDIYNSVESPSNTMIDNVNVIDRLGVFEVTVDDQQVDIGTVVKAKATLSEFRGAKQLELKRIWIVSTTDEEVQAWDETAAFKQAILSKPWHLSSAEHKRITNELKLERKKTRDYERRKAEHEAKKKERSKAREEYLAQKQVQLEAKQRKEHVIMNAGALT